MAYLVLHIEPEFIAASVTESAGGGTPLLHGKETFFWLYFFNDRSQNKVTFGNVNRRHFQDLEDEYYGDIFNRLASPDETFFRNGIERPIIELLDISGLIDQLSSGFRENAFGQSGDEIPTLISFSASINTDAQVKFVAFLIERRFKIVSTEIPVCEIVANSLLKAGKLPSVKEGQSVIFLEGINSTLHLHRLFMINGYLIADPESALSKYGMGYDPRKKAIINFVVNEVNKSTNLLNYDQSLKEIERFESVAEDWLKRIDEVDIKSPVYIRNVSLSPAPSIQRDVVIFRKNIDEDSGRFVNDLITLFTSFEAEPRKFINSSVTYKAELAMVIMLGDSFSNQLIGERFAFLLKEKFKRFPLELIVNSLPVYAGVGLHKYGDRVSRSEIIREFFTKVEKGLRGSILYEKSKKDYKKYRIEVERTKGGILLLEKVLDEILANVNEAAKLNEENNELREFLHQLLAEKAGNKVIINRYKDLIAGAEQLEKKGNIENYRNALTRLKQAKLILDTDEVSRRINNLEILFIEAESKQSFVSLSDKIKLHITAAESSRIQGKFEEAVEQLEKAESLLNKSQGKQPEMLDFYSTITLLKSEIKQEINLRDAEFNDLVKKGEEAFSRADYEISENLFNEALSKKSGNRHCLDYKEKIKRKKNDQLSFNKLKEAGDRSYDENNLEEAKINYLEAIIYDPANEHCKDRIEKIESKKRSIENDFNKWKSEADQLVGRREWKKAINAYEEALKIKPDDSDISSLITAVKQKLAEEQEKEKVYEACVEKANDYYNRKEWKLARMEFFKAMSLKPEKDLFRLQLASIDAELRNARRKLMRKALVAAGGLLLFILIGLLGFKTISAINNKKPAKVRQIAVSSKKPDTDTTNSSGGAVVPSNPDKPEIVFSGGSGGNTIPSGGEKVINPGGSKPGSDSNAVPSKPKPVPVQIEPVNISFSDGLFLGQAKNGKPEGKGKYTYSVSTTVYPDDPGINKKVEPGYYIEGIWKNGELYTGKLYSADGIQICRINRGR